jgi:hypothetical protein
MTRVTWSTVTTQLKDLSPAEWQGLLRELFQSSREAQDYLTRWALRRNPPALFKLCRQRIVAQFFPPGGEPGPLDLAAAQGWINDYQALTHDRAGTIDLLLTLVESGTRFTKTYGSVDADYYARLGAALSELADLLSSPRGRSLYPRFRKRLIALQQEAVLIGWGYEDAVAEIVDQLRDDQDDWDERLSPPTTEPR